MDVAPLNMDTAFFIDLTIKKDEGYLGYGRFYIGDDRQVAIEVFDLLQGTPELDENSVLRLDFMEMKRGVPINIKVLNCTLSQIAENCRIITKETFKRFSLGI